MKIYAALVTASIISDLLNSERFAPKNGSVTVVLNDEDGNLATVYWDASVARWKWKEGVDQVMLEEWAQQSLYRQQLSSSENGDENED